MKITNSLLAQLPKVELHCHLDGSLRVDTILDLANTIINASGLSLKPIHGPELSGDVRSTQADTQLIRKLLNWEPKIRLDNWLTKIISNKDFQDI